MVHTIAGPLTIPAKTMPVKVTYYILYWQLLEHKHTSHKRPVLGATK